MIDNSKLLAADSPWSMTLHDARRNSLLGRTLIASSALTVTRIRPMSAELTPCRPVIFGQRQSSVSGERVPGDHNDPNPGAGYNREA